MYRLLLFLFLLLLVGPVIAQPDNKAAVIELAKLESERNRVQLSVNDKYQELQGIKSALMAFWSDPAKLLSSKFADSLVGLHKKQWSGLEKSGTQVRRLKDTLDKEIASFNLISNELRSNSDSVRLYQKYTDSLNQTEKEIELMRAAIARNKSTVTDSRIGSPVDINADLLYSGLRDMHKYPNLIFAEKVITSFYPQLYSKIDRILENPAISTEDVIQAGHLLDSITTAFGFSRNDGIFFSQYARLDNLSSYTYLISQLDNSFFKKQYDAKERASLLELYGQILTDKEWLTPSQLERLNEYYKYSNEYCIISNEVLGFLQSAEFKRKSKMDILKDPLMQDISPYPFLKNEVLRCKENNSITDCKIHEIKDCSKYTDYLNKDLKE